MPTSPGKRTGASPGEPRHGEHPKERGFDLATHHAANGTARAQPALTLTCPVTSKVKGYPFEVPVSTTAGVQGVVLADQLRSLDWRARRAEWIEQAQPKVVERVLKLLDTLPTS